MKRETNFVLPACQRVSRKFQSEDKLRKEAANHNRGGAGTGLKSRVRKAPPGSQRTNVLGSGKAQFTRMKKSRNTDTDASRCIQTIVQAPTDADYCCAFRLLSEQRCALNTDVHQDLLSNTTARSLQPCIWSTRWEEMVGKAKTICTTLADRVCNHATSGKSRLCRPRKASGKLPHEWLCQDYTTAPVRAPVSIVTSRGDAFLPLPNCLARA